MNEKDLILQSSEKMKQSKAYWLDLLSDDVSRVDLPTDFPGVGRNEQKTALFTLSQETISKLKKLANNDYLTIYTVLLANLEALLLKITRQNDLVLGVPVYYKSQAEHTTNTLLPFRNSLVESMSFKELLISTRNRLLACYSHQIYPLHDILSEESLMTLAAVTIRMRNIHANSGYEDRVNTAEPGMDFTIEMDEQNLRIQISYNVHLYRETTIRNIGQAFRLVLDQALNDLDMPLHAIAVVDKHEEYKVIVEFNATESDYPAHKTLHQLFEEQVRKNPAQIAVVFEDRKLTYQELNEKANALARVLRAKGVDADSIVGIMLERSPEMIIGLIAILKAGGAYLPIESEYPLDRIQYMLEDSGAQVVLTQQQLQDRITFPVETILLDSDAEEIYRHDVSNLESVSNPESLVYVIYTSGTTGKPKGVMFRNKSLVNLIFFQQKKTSIDLETRVLQFATIAFDVASQEIMSTLLLGGELHLIDNETRKNINSLLNFLKRQEISTVFLPTAFFKLIASDSEYINRLAHLVKDIVVAGEQLIVEPHILRLLDEYNVKLHNHYGPTETHVVTAITLDKDSRRIPPIGKPVSNTSIYVLDKSKQAVPVGIPGDLYISGDCLARGYLNNAVLTNEKFIDDPFHFGQKMYRTGDLAKWLPDGNLEFLGRIDHQVKIRGFRVEIGEVESNLLSIEGVKEVVVLTKGQEESKYLCAYYVSQIPYTSARLREMLAANLPDYMIPSYFVQLPHMPLTTNGKVDRRALPEPEGSSSETVEYVAPANAIEEELVSLWSDVLKVPHIGTHHDFFALGGHSLKATTLVGRIHKQLNVEVPLKAIFELGTIKDLAAYISTLTDKQFEAIEKVPEQPYYEASPAQKRMYLLQEFDRNSVAYNIPGVIEITGELDRNRLQEAFSRIVERHETLRTTFDTMGEIVVQKVHRAEEIVLRVEEILVSNADEANIAIKNFVRPFDLQKEIAIRVALITLEAEKHLLLFDMHHIVADGVTMGILVKEFSDLYAGKTLEPLKLQYKDYAAWQLKKRDSATWQAQQGYWLEAFEGEVPLLNLPTDYPRPRIKDFRGASLDLVVPKDLTASLNRLAQETGSTMYMVLLACITVLLAKYTGQEDLVVGSPIAGRNHKDLEQMIGVFVNTLALRNTVKSEQPFQQYLSTVKARALQAYEHQEYPFEELVEQLNLERNLNRNPLFDVMFALQNTEIGDLYADKLRFSQYHSASDIEKVDLTINATELAGEILLNFSYATSLFTQETIARISKHFINIMQEIVSKTDIKIKNIPILTDVEKRMLLENFGNAQSAYPKNKTIRQLFEEQVERNPHNVAVVYGNQKLTYQELNEQANSLARALQERGAGPEVILGMLVERSVEMIVGIFAILKAGGAYLPIDPTYPEDRIKFMLEDSGAKILLTQGHVFNLSEIAEKYNVSCIDIDDLALYKGEANNPPANSASYNTAYVMYTSGSTGKPKGNLTTHYNIVRIAKNTNYIHIDENDALLQLSNYAFDGSTFDIFGALLNGARLVITSKHSMLNMSELGKLIQREEVTVFFVTTALFNTLVDANIECFANIRHVLFGGERVSFEHVKKAFRYLGAGRLIHVYGPTETTVFATYHIVNHLNEALGTIPIGKPVSNTSVYILDKNDNLQPVGVIGDLCIAGDGLAKGYLNRSELTREKFGPNPFQPQERIYRTGDLARWLPDGQIEFIGRVDHQVKLRGFRIELGEIESYLLKIAGLKEATVIDRDKNGFKYLCAYYVSEKEYTASELREQLLNNLPDYMIPSHFISLPQMPLTTNGKIDRKALPEPEEDTYTSVAYVAPTNEIEQKLAWIWSEVLKVATIGINDNFFELGGHSLKATVLASRIYRELNVEVPLKAIFELGTIKDLAIYISTLADKQFEAIEKVPEQPYYEASPAQKRMYLLQEFDKNSVAYNIPWAMEIAGKLDKNRLQETFWQLIARHETLRTTFDTIEGVMVQKVHPIEAIDFKVEEIVVLDQDNALPIMKAFIRPFDLQKEIAIRAALITLKAEKHLLLFDMHHIVADGVTMGILVKEFSDLYAGKTLEPLKLQYKDYAAWQLKKRDSATWQTQQSYWLEAFEGEVPLLNLPTDYPRPRIKDFRGASLDLVVPKDLTASLNRLAQETGSTMYMVLLACITVLLAKYTGQEDLVVGSPIAGRNHKDLEQMIGVFVNTLALRNTVKSEQTFQQYLSTVKARALQAYEHQEYPFEELVEQLNLERNLNRNPLFDVMFVLQNTEIAELYAENLEFKQCVIENQIEKFDMTINARELNGEIYFNFGYATALFKQKTIQCMAEHLVNIIRQIGEKPEIPLADIDIISDKEKQALKAGYNNTACDFPQNTTLQQLFEEQVAKTPENIAVVFEHDKLTYRQLNAKANTLACVLREYGVERGDFIGIRVHRSIELIVGILAILKSGAAYIPIEMNYPLERIKYILTNSGCKLLVTEDDFAPEELDVKLINIHNEKASNAPINNPEPRNAPSDIAYIIYTSGSTGVPKGVVITHVACINTLIDINRKFSVTEEDKILSISSICFDLSVYDIFGALIAGARIVLVKDPKNVQEIVHTLARENITLWNSVPAFMELVVGSVADDYRNSTLKTVMLSGDWISLKLPANIKHHFPRANVISLGGATEGSIWSIYYPITEVKKEWKSIPYGAPLANQQMYIIDKNLKLQPTGIVGEICIGGLGVAEGYANDPVKTARSFVTHPVLGKIYRTGDLGILRDGKYIEFLGRMDHQVKIRGFRIELEEIESNLLHIDGIREATVLDREKDGVKYLCAYYVSHNEYVISELREQLLRNLPDYMIPSYFIRLPQMPLTSNGKVDRKALPEPEDDVSTGTEYVAPSNAIEERLVSIWSDVLKVKVLGVEDNFFELGGHSLHATTILARIHKEFNVEVPLTELFIRGTIRLLSEYILSVSYTDFVAIEKVEEKAYYEASSAQKRMYLLQEFDKTSVAYNMPWAIDVGSALELDALQETLLTIMCRHEVLRTNFEMVDGVIVQRVHSMQEIAFKVAEINVLNEQEVPSCMQKFIKPFDLTKDILLRVALVKLPQTKILFFDMHHIISDGTSMGILMKEFAEIYAGREPEPLKLQYKDYAAWQLKKRESKAFKAQEEYWLKEFAEDVPVLSLLTDYPRPRVKDFAGDSVNFTIDKETTARLNALARETGSTLYMVLLACITILLSKNSGQEDIVVGSPIAGRNHRDLENIIGIFLNTLAIRSTVDSDLSFNAYLQVIKEKALQAYEHQDYPFEELVEKLGLGYSLNRNPLFDVMFILQNVDAGELQTQELQFKQYIAGYAVEKLDLTMTATELPAGIAMSFNYATSLFQKETVERMVGHFLNILDVVVKDSEIKLVAIDIMSAEEKRLLLEDFNDTACAYPRSMTIHQMFEAQVEKTPEETALVFEEKKLTYRELNERANLLANVLRAKGVEANTIVALLMERSLDLLVGLLAVLKAGGAYLPIDPSYPEDRIKYMLADSCTQLILTGHNFQEQVIDDYEVVRVSDIISAGSNISNLPVISSSDDLAYVIYTSGSTGKPKGVMIGHRQVLNFAEGMKIKLDLPRYKSMLCITTISFDIFVLETLVPLMNGLKVVITPDGEDINGGKLRQTILTNAVEIMQSTPSRLSILLKNASFVDALGTLKAVLCGGEPMPSAIASMILQQKNLRLYNMYGPTETTVWSLVDEVTDPEKISIGKPISNTQVYILDKANCLVLPSMLGELCIGGEGLACGYLNRAELTRARFIDNPFQPGARIYKTGDLASWRMDGTVEFQGRVDNQVKIRGYRIELGEIENCMLKLEGMKEVKVIDKEKDGIKHLCAYYVSEIDYNVTDLREALKASLPEYMLPSYFVALSKMPLTNNGKINVLKLRELEITFTHEYVQPRNAIEDFLLKELCETLAIDNIGITDNIFEFGANSLSIMRFIQRVQGRYEVEYADIARNPYIIEIARIVKPRKEGILDVLANLKTSVPSLNSPQLLAQQNQIQQDLLAYRQRIEREYSDIDLLNCTNYRNILITGATGYLGSYLLRDLLHMTEAKISLIIRGANASEALQRLATTFQYYFTEDICHYADRITIYAGDLSKANLGLLPEDYAALAENVDCIINSAADVNHYGLYEHFYKANVGSVENLLKLCQCGQAKYFVHVSTTSVGSGNIENVACQLYSEYEDFVGQRSDNNYVTTKIEAEKRVFEARKQGIKSTIFRVGNLVFHSKTGKYQRNIEANGFYQRIRSLLTLKKVPDTLVEDIEFSFIDSVSQAIVLMFNRVALENEVFHITNPHNISYSAFANYARQLGVAIDALPFEDLLDYLIANYNTSSLKECIDILLIHFNLLDRKTETRFVVTCEKSTYILAKLGFMWDRVNTEHIRNMLEYGQKMDFFAIEGVGAAK